MKYQTGNRLLDIAIEASMAGGNHAKERQDDVSAVDKADGTSVTAADQEVEDIVRKKLENHTKFPVWGEETNDKPQGDSYWVIDPIDGTKNYIDGLPMYSTSISLIESGEQRVSSVAVPELDDIYYAEDGFGAYCNGQQLSVSSERTTEGIVSCTSGYGADLAHTVCQDVYGGWIRRLTAAAYSMLTVATGATEVCLVSHVYPWDIGGAGLIISEAGGEVSSIPNRDQSWNSIKNGGVLAWNGDEQIWNDLENYLDDDTVSQLSEIPDIYKSG